MIFSSRLQIRVELSCDFEAVNSPEKISTEFAIPIKVTPQSSTLSFVVFKITASGLNKRLRKLVKEDCWSLV